MTDIPPGQVTTADLYRVLVMMQADLSKALTRLEVINNRNTNADTIHHDHETRLRSLESAKAKLVGAVAAVGALSGAAGTWAGLVIGRH